MFKNGWVRLTIVAWVTWVLWSLSQKEWSTGGMCDVTTPAEALCWTWEFFFPPVLAVGVWWTLRAFGTEKVEKALSDRKTPTVAALMLLVGLAVLGSRVAALRQQVEAVQGKVDEVDDQTNGVGDRLESIETRLDGIKSSVEDIETEVTYSRR